MELLEFDNRVNYRLECAVPEVCRTQPCCLGIDEAGRGPVLGPMVYGTCFCPLSETSVLNSMGFADSKTLNEEQRDALFAKIDAASDLIGYVVDVLSPNYISNGMLAKSKYNLNQISHDTAIGLIRRALDRGVDVKEVYVDTVGDPASYQAKLKAQFPNLEITVAKKADATYPIVSAASICAKVARDKVVKEWCFIESGGQAGSSVQYGSGYPGDPKTKQYLADSLDHVFGFSQFVRFSWSTASLILTDRAVTVCWEDDDEGGEGGARREDIRSVPAITSFFHAAPASQGASPPNAAPPPPTLTHQFFIERALKQTIDL